MAAARPPWCRTARQLGRRLARAPASSRLARAARAPRLRMQPAMRQAKKGKENAATSLTQILVLLGRADMGGVYDIFRQRAAEAIVNAFGKLDAVRRAEQIEISL